MAVSWSQLMNPMGGGAGGKGGGKGGGGRDSNSATRRHEITKLPPNYKCYGDLKDWEMQEMLMEMDKIWLNYTVVKNGSRDILNMLLFHCTNDMPWDPLPTP